MNFPNRSDLNFWQSHKQPLFGEKVGFIQHVPKTSIHSVVNSHSGVKLKRYECHTFCTLNLVRMRLKREEYPTAVSAMEGLYNCGADPRRAARVRKWINRIYKDRREKLLEEK